MSTRPSTTKKRIASDNDDMYAPNLDAKSAGLAPHIARTDAEIRELSDDLKKQKPADDASDTVQQDVMTFDENSPFLTAILKNRHDHLEDMLTANQGLANSRVHESVYKGSLASWVNKGDSALHVAVAVGSPDCVEVLCEFGADPHKMNTYVTEDGKAAPETPIRVAEIEYQLEVAPKAIYPRIFSYLKSRPAMRPDATLEHSEAESDTSKYSKK